MVGSKTTMTRSPFPFLAAAWIWLIVLGQSPFHVAGDPYWTSENMSPEEVLQAFVAARNGTVGLNRKWNRTATAAQRRMARMKQLESDPERKERIHRVLRNTKPQIEQLVPMTPDELVRMEEQNPNLRARKVSQSYSPYSLGNLADPGADYSMWAQAFRMLGGFIDCGHNKFSDSHKGNSHNYNFENKDGSCSRWMMWAAYVDPNYQGKGYNEYRGDNPVGTLDCHQPNTNWKLMGVYRQEFYQFIEQISKHLWAMDDYDYVVALASLAYMTDNDCFGVNDKDSSGNAIYAGIAPQPMGKFQIALYTDEYCLTPNTNLGKTYDSYGYTTSLDLNDNGGNNNKNNKNGNNNNNNNNYQKKNYNQNSDVYTWWSSAQEYTLTDLNDVYEEYKYCTPCVDYPTYQDGYLIGNSGTDDESLINQCWKFYSHNSYPCTADCISLGHAQGTILSVDYNGVIFGKHLDESNYVQEVENGVATNAYQGEPKWKRLMANLFAALSFVVFVATFLAFAVARRSRYRESRSSKSRRLLDDDDRATTRSRKLTRSPSKDKGDGLFRSPSGGRSKSTDKNRRKSRSKSADKRSKSKSRNSENYNPPETNSPGEKSGRKSRRVVDDF